MPGSSGESREGPAGPNLVRLAPLFDGYWYGPSTNYCHGVHLSTHELLYGFGDDDQVADDGLAERDERLLLASMRVFAALR